MASLEEAGSCIRLGPWLKGCTLPEKETVDWHTWEKGAAAIGASFEATKSVELVHFGE